MTPSTAADLTESTLKVNTSFSDVICEAYVCSSDSICQTNDEEIEETSLARELKELKLEKKHTDRHLEVSQFLYNFLFP